MDKVDVSAFRIQPDGIVEQSLADEHSSGETVSGAPFAAQRVIIELLTIQGSIQYMPRRGSKFITYLMQGANSERDVFVAFAAARSDILANLQSEDLSGDPLSEQVENVQLLNLAVLEGSVMMRVGVTSKDKSVITFNLPLDFQF